MRLLTIDEAELKGWLEAIPQGSKVAENALMESVFPWLGLMAGRMLRRFPKVREWVEVDDISQDAALRLLRALRTMEGLTPEHFEVLALTQVRRQLYDQARQVTRKMKSNNDGLNQLVTSDSSIDYSEHIEQTVTPAQLDRWTSLHEHAEKLPIREREAFSLTYYHNWSTVQIGELFHVDDRTVRRWYQSACEALREQLGADAPVG